MPPANRCSDTPASLRLRVLRRSRRLWHALLREVLLALRHAPLH